MDLETISAQMNSVIQKHQMVVIELRSDPQNPVLLKRLNDLQAEIRSLNDRQKQVVEGLRKNLEKPNTNASNFVTFPPTAQSPRLQVPNLETQGASNVQKSPVLNNKLPTTTLMTKPIANNINTVRQIVPPTINNITTPTATTFTFKAPIGTVVLPNCSTAANTLITTKVAEHQKMHPVLVVPSPSNRTADGPQTGVLLNLVPPIRVPQYPPPLPRNPVPVKKNEFLSYLGLVSKDSMSDLKSKKQERKRRSTANPQFSNAALEEKWRIAAAAQASAIPQKRPRGRPRLETKHSASSNGICNVKDLKKDTSLDSNPVTSSSSPSNDSTTVVNGIHKPVNNFEEGKNVEQMLSGLCMVCTQPGELVKCDTCAKQQHLGCMQPPLVTRPQVPWQCSECQSRTVSLTVVQNYDMLKAAKEDEKKKLLKKSLELTNNHSQLKVRLSQLKEYSSNQKIRQSELQNSLKGTETLVEHISSVINVVRLCS